MQGVNNEHTFTQDAMEITSHSVRLATWKEVLLGGDQTHDALDDCRDLRDIVAKISQDENVDMARVIDTSEEKHFAFVKSITFLGNPSKTF